jgi:formylglycine-generating enzyme required for sulfatase activity
MGSSAGEQANSTHPVSEVAWNDVQAFLTKLADRVPGASFGLPSEAQWEYACRAGTRNTRYGEVDEIAWTSRNASGSTHPVAQLQPNAWGLYDMLGNVWEWCADAWTRYGTAPCVDPRTTEGGERVRRGGSWGSDARFARAACRMAHAANDRYGNVGFRMIRRGDPPQAK